MSLTRTAPPSADEGLEFDAELFDKLRALRKKLADELNAPAFVVFGDAALRQMALHAPLDHDSLLRIKGVGESKMRQYGERFIEVIREHAGERGGASVDRQSGQAPPAGAPPGAR